MSNVEEACRIARRETRRLSQPHVVLLAEGGLRQFFVMQTRLYAMNEQTEMVVYTANAENSFN